MLLHIFESVIVRPFLMIFLFGGAIYIASLLYRIIPEGRIKAFLYKRHWIGDRDPTIFIGWVVGGVLLYTWFWFLNGRHF